MLLFFNALFTPFVRMFVLALLRLGSRRTLLFCVASRRWSTALRVRILSGALRQHCGPNIRALVLDHGG